MSQGRQVVITDFPPVLSRTYPPSRASRLNRRSVADETIVQSLSLAWRAAELCYFVRQRSHLRIYEHANQFVLLIAISM